MKTTSGKINHFTFSDVVFISLSILQATAHKSLLPAAALLSQFLILHKHVLKVRTFTISTFFLILFLQTGKSFIADHMFNTAGIFSAR